MANNDELQGKLDLLKQLHAQGVLNDAQYQQQVAVLGGSVGIIGDDANIEGDLVTGSKETTFDQHDQAVVSQVNVAHLTQIYHAAPGEPELDDDAVARVVEDYLTWVCNTYSGTRLYGAANTPLGQGKSRLRLPEVFIPLTLARFRPPRERDLEHLAGDGADEEALARAWVHWAAREGHQGEVVPLKDLLTLNGRVAVVGGAGSGKSTLLAYLAIPLAEAAAQEPPYQLPCDLPDPEHLPLPLLIPLRYYRDYLNRCDLVPHQSLPSPELGTLADFIPWYLQRRNPALKLSRDFFNRLLKGGGCLLLLDGLDEVVNREERGMVRQEVEYLLDAVYPGNRCIVTAREAGYTDDAIFSNTFTRLDVRPLEQSQITELVRNWCHLLYPGAVNAQTEAISAAIADVNRLRAREDLPPLVNTPLMTTMVISVKWDKAELPRERARLYEACVEVILQAQYIPTEGPRDTARKEMVEWGGPWQEQQDWLAQLALAMHAGGKDGSAIRETRLREMLAEHVTPEALAQFIQAVRDRGGLLEERGEFFQFLHLTFQEFLAARLLAKQRRAGWACLLERLTDPWWREVILLTYGFARADYAPGAKEYLDWLSTAPEGAGRLAGLELAGAALLELEQPDAAHRETQAARLAAAVTRPPASAPAGLRARAGNVLAQLGDPRAEITTLAGMRFCYVPPGRFWMGSDEDEREQPAGWHAGLDYGYWIAQYPLTVAQWREYVGASGHQPRDKDSLQGVENHPVVWVTWHEARELTAWLTDRVQQAGWLPANWAVRLPSEAEWEKAARGGERVPQVPQMRALQTGLEILGDAVLVANHAPRRVYPWGDEWVKDRANTSKSELSTTSPVGIFPEGVSPYGCLDMVGNVWEWTRSHFKNYPYQADDGRENLEAGDSVTRVLRGGAFYLPPRIARCAFRYWDNPYIHFGDLGFRIVVSPSRL